MKTSDLRDIMRIAWQLVRKNGFTMSEALKTAWLNFKLKMKMRYGIVKFYYQKISGEIREAYGTLRADLMPQTKGADRKPNPTVQVYYDSEREEYRCFKIANLIKIA
ncbi:DUF2693 domain-containing protein [Alistipes sp. AF17-16]|uniref:SH3 beta-barrel fold-containing protein n=1 Tax=Alistipes TaxID=239759 RepID=UPI000E4D48DA|nr:MULTISPECIES: SH3 beta-barrel fold-containing protein [Alistipes]RHR67867.1 DUF2693 domain-containing protein [Alistipes sp. AF17-16]